jgi:hypothetical protein
MCELPPSPVGTVTVCTGYSQFGKEEIKKYVDDIEENVTIYTTKMVRRNHEA